MLHKTDLGIFIKTCKKDHEWLKYCLLSIEKNTNDFSGLCIITDTDHNNIVEYKNIITKIPVEIHFVEAPDIEHTCQDGIGYLWMQNIKLLWHKYCEYDNVLQIDSDCVINDILTPNFYRENNHWKWFVRDWSISELAIVHKKPLTKLLGKESQYEHMPVPGWILDKETTIDFHNWIYEKYGCSWWEYLCDQTKKDWGLPINEDNIMGSSRGSSVYNAYGGFLENNKTVNKYRFIINDLSNPPPVKQYWSWKTLDALTEDDIKNNLNQEEQKDLLSIKIDSDFDEKFYQKEYPETKDFHQPYCTNYNIDDKRRLFYHYKMYGNNRYKNLLQKSSNMGRNNI